MRNYYRILGIRADATPDEIKEAWIFGLKAFHPDKFAVSSQRAVAEERTKAINEAYAILSDPTRRANYDREYARNNRTESTPPPPPRSAPPPTQTASARVAPQQSVAPRDRWWHYILKDYLLLEGRIGRLTFTVRVCALLVGMFLFVVADELQGQQGHAVSLLQVILGLYCFIFLVLFVIQAGKRLHDLNASPAWILAGVTGIGALVLTVALPLVAGTRGANKYGPPAKTSRATKIAGALIGALALIGLVIAIIPAISSTGPRLNSPMPKASDSVPTAPSLHQLHVVTGTGLHYSLTLPNDWNVKRKDELSKERSGDFDLIASHKTAYVGIIAEEANLGSPDTVITFGQKFIMEKDPNAHFTAAKSITIDGKSWQSFTAHASVEKIPFAYEFCVCTGPEGTYQIVGWTFSNLFDRDAENLRSVMRSFKFPPTTSETGSQVASSETTAASSLKLGIKAPTGVPQPAPSSLFPPLGATTPLPVTTESSLQTTPTPSQTPMKRLTLVQIAAKISPSVVALRAYNSQGEELKTGTGFFVHPTGGIATNWHVISGANRVTATASTGEVLEVADVARYDPKLDLALCTVSQTGDRKFPAFAIYRKQLPPMGTSVAVLGNPEGLEQSLSEGIVSATRRDDAGTLIQITAPISPGSSGSPVVDNTGSLVGVAGATWHEGQNLNFARSALDLVSIWHDLRPKTFAEVGIERNDALMASDVVENYRRAYKRKDMPEMLRLALAIREAFPDVPGAYMFTGETLVGLRDWKHAIAEYEQARLLFPEMPDTWQRLGELYEWTGQTRRAQECFSQAKHFAKVVRDNAKLLREAEAKKSTSPVVRGEPPAAGTGPATDIPLGANVTTVNGADCHVIKYKAGWTDGDLINTRTGPGETYSAANKIAVGEKRLAMEFWSTPNGATPWVRVFRWNNDKKDSAIFVGWANKNFFRFDARPAEATTIKKWSDDAIKRGADWGNGNARH